MHTHVHKYKHELKVFVRVCMCVYGWCLRVCDYICRLFLSCVCVCVCMWVCVCVCQNDATCMHKHRVIHMHTYSSALPDLTTHLLTQVGIPPFRTYMIQPQAEQIKPMKRNKHTKINTIRSSTRQTTRRPPVLYLQRIPAENRLDRAVQQPASMTRSGSISRRCFL